MTTPPRRHSPPDKCYPPVITPPAFPEWAVRRFYVHDSKPDRTNRMYGGSFLGDAVSEPRDYYIYQTYTTRSPDDVLPALFYASASALTLSEGGTPENCRVRVGVGKNLVPPDPGKPTEYDPADPNIVWGEWVSTQGYPWKRTPSVQVMANTVGDKLTVFVHFNQQAEYEGKYNVTLADSVWLHTQPYPKPNNIRFFPTNEDSTEWRVQWETDVPGTSEVWRYDWTYERTKWAYGTSGPCDYQSRFQVQRRR